MLSLVFCHGDHFLTGWHPLEKYKDTKWQRASSRVQDVLVDAVHDEWDRAHHGGPEDGGVALVALAHLRRHVSHRVGRGVTHLKCQKNTQMLSILSVYTGTG